MVIAYSAAVDDCENSRQQWAEALTLFSDMQQCKVQANVFTDSDAISACEKG